MASPIPVYRPLYGRSFYLDLIGYGRKRIADLEKDLSILGAVIDKFFSKEVCYLITNRVEAKEIRSSSSLSNCSRPSPFGFKGTSPLDAAAFPETASVNQHCTRGKAVLEKATISEAQGSSKVVSNAQLWGIPVRHVDCINRWLLKVKANHPTLFVGSTKQVQCDKAKLVETTGRCLKMPYIKVEDNSRHYRPVHAELASWPRLLADSRTGVSAFNVRKPDACRSIDPASLSVPKPSNDMWASPATPAEQTAVANDGSLRKLITRGEFQRRNLRARKAGYCESCCLNYNCLEKHLLDPKHRQYVDNHANYADLDRLIASAHSWDSFLTKLEADREEVVARPLLLRSPRQSANKAASSEQKVHKENTVPEQSPHEASPIKRPARKRLWKELSPRKLSPRKQSPRKRPSRKPLSISGSACTQEYASHGSSPSKTSRKSCHRYADNDASQVGGAAVRRFDRPAPRDSTNPKNATARKVRSDKDDAEKRDVGFDLPRLRLARSPKPTEKATASPAMSTCRRLYVENVGKTLSTERGSPTLRSSPRSIGGDAGSRGSSLARNSPKRLADGGEGKERWRAALRCGEVRSSPGVTKPGVLQKRKNSEATRVDDGEEAELGIPPAKDLKSTVSGQPCDAYEGGSPVAHNGASTVCAQAGEVSSSWLPKLRCSPRLAQKTGAIVVGARLDERESSNVIEPVASAGNMQTSLPLVNASHCNASAGDRVLRNNDDCSCAENNGSVTELLVSRPPDACGALSAVVATESDLTTPMVDASSSSQCLAATSPIRRARQRRRPISSPRSRLTPSPAAARSHRGASRAVVTGCAADEVSGEHSAIACTHRDALGSKWRPAGRSQLNDHYLLSDTYPGGKRVLASAGVQQPGKICSASRDRPEDQGCTTEVSSWANTSQYAKGECSENSTGKPVICDDVAILHRSISSQMESSGVDPNIMDSKPEIVLASSQSPIFSETLTTNDVADCDDVSVHDSETTALLAGHFSPIPAKEPSVQTGEGNAIITEHGSETESLPADPVSQTFAVDPSTQFVRASPVCYSKTDVNTPDSKSEIVFESSYSPIFPETFTQASADVVRMSVPDSENVQFPIDIVKSVVQERKSDCSNDMGRQRLGLDVHSRIHILENDVVPMVVHCGFPSCELNPGADASTQFSTEPMDISHSVLGCVKTKAEPMPGQVLTTINTAQHVENDRSPVDKLTLLVSSNGNLQQERTPGVANEQSAGEDGEDLLEILTLNFGESSDDSDAWNECMDRFISKRTSGTQRDTPLPTIDESHLLEETPAALVAGSADANTLVPGAGEGVPMRSPARDGGIHGDLLLKTEGSSECVRGEVVSMTSDAVASERSCRAETKTRSRTTRKSKRKQRRKPRSNKSCRASTNEPSTRAELSRDSDATCRPVAEQCDSTAECRHRSDDKNGVDNPPLQNTKLVTTFQAGVYTDGGFAVTLDGHRPAVATNDEAAPAPAVFEVLDWSGHVSDPQPTPSGCRPSGGQPCDGGHSRGLACENPHAAGRAVTRTLSSAKRPPLARRENLQAAKIVTTDASHPGLLPRKAHTKGAVLPIAVQCPVGSDSAAH
ncbi:PREDICTED: uncharacterized protein LOC106812174 [Priapulus caudatus]|uniref:Uncharacterized protein LOC106812174 n=1 Tax=Priapulus caudatus TaxID=37621 RepID=A0ABM1EH11_PRICU|nr:PREDICTED: uncharacterized protein LOC106812174 [Priapulus caudatus]